jgi:hypothetical protein
MPSLVSDVIADEVGIAEHSEERLVGVCVRSCSTDIEGTRKLDEVSSDCLAKTIPFGFGWPPGIAGTHAREDFVGHRRGSLGRAERPSGGSSEEAAAGGALEKIPFVHGHFLRQLRY